MANILNSHLRSTSQVISIRHIRVRPLCGRVFKTSLVIVTLMLCLIASLGRGQEPEIKRAKKSSVIAREQIQKFKDNVKSLALSLEYRGPQDKPFYNLLLSVPMLRDAIANLEHRPFSKSAQMTEETAGKIIDYLVDDGFFNRVMENVRRSPAPPKDPYYALTLTIVGDPQTRYEEWLVFDLKMLERLDGLHKLLEGDGAKGMETLLTRLSGYRKKWLAESQFEVTNLIPHLDADDGEKRAAATQAILHAGTGAIEPLETVGAKQISPFGTLETRRIDMVYSLIVGLQPNQVGAKAGYKSDGFGIKFEATATKADVVEMGKRYGFVLDGAFTADGQPNCYVKLAKNQDLHAVLKALLAEETSVISVNLAYFEQ